MTLALPALHDDLHRLNIQLRDHLLPIPRERLAPIERKTQPFIPMDRCHVEWRPVAGELHESQRQREYNDLDVLCGQGKICIVLVSLVVLCWCLLSLVTYFCPARIQSLTRRVIRPCAGRNCGAIIAEQLRCAACYLRCVRHHIKGRPMSVFAAANSMDAPWLRRIRILSRLTMTHEITV